MLEFIGMAILAIAIGMNLKEYRHFFMKKEKKIKRDEDFEKAIENINESDTTENKIVAKTLVKVTFIITFICQLLFYGLLASLTGVMWMYILGLIIVFLHYSSMKDIYSKVNTKNVKFKEWTNIVIPLKTIFYFSFIVLFWIL